MANITITTQYKRQVIDITDQIERNLSRNGLVNLLLTHTTAAITTADLDPGTDKDILTAVSSLTPLANWKHPHDPEHFPDHLWSSLIGTSLTLPFNDGKLLLGRWQRVILIEFDGPRQRELRISIGGELIS